ncbi:hypothetical protein B0H15DRAFT_533538 [Mycena belliarum]|uniref:Protein kinase domain-containing protein n=1 Tax=Mycena belliarum TaxID=1033014 RepID=A0AAD6TX91_9AGAR|nr:hypothetical protein B0H15DRAFT_533538 [Mycena belliae]
MATKIRIHFQGDPRVFVARSWRIPPTPDHPDEFEFKPIPAHIDLLSVPRGRNVFANREGDRKAQALELDWIKSWGIDADVDSCEWNLIYATARASRPDGRRFCLRLIANIDEDFDQDSKRYRSFCRLVKDAMFHSTELNDSQVAGWLVPIHYGMWTMNTRDWGGKIFVSITQGCGVSWNELSYTNMNTRANRLLVARTYEALHDYGFEHGSMWSDNPFRHAIINIHAPGLTLADRLNGKAPCYIVDFSEARAHHRCKRKIPLLPLDTYIPPATMGCQEIADALLHLGFIQSSKQRTGIFKTTPALEAVQWHDRYTSEHPDLRNFKVMMAQRAKLYPEFLPVHPTFLMEFADEGLHARVEVDDTIPDSESDDESESDDDTQSDDGTQSDDESEVLEPELVPLPDSPSPEADSMDVLNHNSQPSDPDDPVSV